MLKSGVGFGADNANANLTDVSSDCPTVGLGTRRCRRINKFYASKELRREPIRLRTETRCGFLL